VVSGKIFLVLLAQREENQYDRVQEDGFMFRLWARTFKDNHMLQDACIADGSDDTRTHKIFRALEEVCVQFDLGKPIWLDNTILDFKRHNKVRFRQDNFIEEIDFDYLEIQVIEED
jgi:hypothetical protein